MKYLKAKATILAFLKGAPVPPNEFAAKLIIATSLEYGL